MPHPSPTPVSAPRPESVAESEVIIVCGPTAAGKSALAAALAEEMDLLIVSADSRQIYRGFDIGTAKPTAAERARVPHAGIDVADPTTRYTAYAWAAEAERAIAQAQRTGRLPLIVGGAGFYMRALVHPVTRAAPAGRERHRARYLVVDPGAPLRDRIARRVDAMLDTGWVDEVASLAAAVPADAPAWQASGYAEVRAYVDGGTSLAEARDRVVIATRQYAKRQRTWFRHQLPAGRVTHLDPDAPGAVRAALAWLGRGGHVPRPMATGGSW